ncbi:hypothetical protein [Ferviditalea candida]|uniref:Uncharacterized protein n=1 Tax=Ferviditalea candida TaxID=3108399 RepID=A0ABU5ZGH0_9BACL|nr:hypothetical protein [Paenibacillaceae bacterium T2]
MRLTFKGTAVLVLLMFAGLFVYQIYDLFGAESQSGDAKRLLYQVCLFQMEILNSLLNDAARLQNTDQLNDLKQAVYSANYAHERLVQAFGENHLTTLNSIPQMLQYIIRLQIGGDRALSKDEADTLRQAGEQFSEMYAVYGKLLSSGGSVFSSQNDKLKSIDQNIYRLLHGKLLE